MKIVVFFLFSFYIPFTVAQDEAVINIDLADVCNEAPICEEQNDQGLVQFQKNLERFSVCSKIDQLKSLKLEPQEFDLLDDQGQKWKLRFHFGFTRTNYRSTDAKLESSQVNTVMKGFQFDERTSASYYNPGNWEKFQDAIRWIDEPTNTFQISIENDKNAFYLSVFHPKFLATYYQKDEGGGNYSYTKAPGNSYLSILAPVPEGLGAFEIKNTAKQMSYSLGYGRKFKIYDSPKLGKFSYSVRVEAGVMTGASRTIYVSKDGAYENYQDKLKIQGATGALGHRLDYKKGKVGAFIEHKYSKTHLKHDFLDGKASYDLDFSTLNFGINIDILTVKRR